MKIIFFIVFMRKAVKKECYIIIFSDSKMIILICRDKGNITIIFKGFFHIIAKNNNRLLVKFINSIFNSIFSNQNKTL